MPNSDRWELKKQKSKSLKLSKKNLGFLAFAIVILQVADAGTLWLVGGSTAKHGDVRGFYGDTFMYAVLVFMISKAVYTKYLFKKSSADEEPEETETEDQTATMVVDTSIPKRTKRHLDPGSEHLGSHKPESWVPQWLKDSVPRKENHWPLNAKAKKFVPVGESNVLDSQAPVFLPKAHVKQEKKLLKSECGGEEAGAIVYRSRHWLQEICQKKQTSSEHKKKSPELVLSKNAQKPVQKKKWQEKVNPNDVKWSSSWSTVQTVAAL